jgi:hypothetical protein
VQYDDDGYVRPKDWVYVDCMRCGNVSIWEDGKQLYPEPAEFTAPPPHVTIADDVRADYLEASAIVRQSPRGAAALLRLCIQKLCKAVGQSGVDARRGPHLPARRVHQSY